MRANPHILRGALCALLAAVAALPAVSAAGPEDFRLAKAIPADVYLAVCSRTHEGHEFLNRQYERVWAEVEAIRLDRDFKRLMRTMQQRAGADMEAFESQWQQMMDLCTSVQWGSLAKREFAFAQRMTFPSNEVVALLLPEEGRTAENFEALSGIARTLVDLMEDEVVLDTSEENGNTIHRVTFPKLPFPFAMMLAHHGDVIVIGFGTMLPEQVWALLGDESSGTLIASDRFREALGRVGPPKDGFVFLDIARMMGQIRGTIDQAMRIAMAGNAPEEGTPEHEQMVMGTALPGRIIDAFDMFEYMISTTDTDGMKTRGRAAVLLRDDAKSRAGYDVFFGNPGFSDPLKYIPKRARDFSVSTGINLSALYKAAVEFVRKNVPDGEVLVGQLGSFKDETGFDLQDDVFGWMEGRLVSFKVPGPTPYSPGDFVYMISVTDEERVRSVLDRIIAIAEPMLAGDGQSQPMATIRDAGIDGAPGFRSVIVPMMAMFGMNAPTIGVKDKWLVVGSSPDIIGEMLEVAAGKAENFGANERFQAEGLKPSGEVAGLSFSDMTTLGEDIGTILQMVPMINMFAPDLARDPVASAAISIIGKMNRVVRKLDFFQSSASMSILDGKVIMTSTVQNYREPPQTAPAPATSPEGSGDEE